MYSPICGSCSRCSSVVLLCIGNEIELKECTFVDVKIVMMSLETAMAIAEILLIGLVFPEFGLSQQVSPQLSGPLIPTLLKS